VKRKLLSSRLLFVIIGVLLSTSVFAAGSTKSPVAEALSKDFPKLQFQSIEPTGVDGLFEVVAGTNVLYYNPKNGVIIFGELFSKDWRNQTAGTRSKLMAAAFKDTRLDQPKTQSSVEGLYEVISGPNVIYFDPKSGVRLIGEMYSKEGKNLTTESRDKASAQAALKELPLDKAIKIGKGKNKIIMFTDPDCPYCRKIEDYFNGRSDITRYVYLFPLEQLHPKSMEKSKVILCSKDKAKAFLEAMGGSLDAGELKPCSDEKVVNTLNENKSLAQKLGIQGTPYLIVNGVAIRGADTKRIDELLADNGKK
jgi:thiol:disulfide interchange protein DsbC